MINSEYKKSLLEMVSKFSDKNKDVNKEENSNGYNNYQQGKKGRNDNKVGSSNIRSLANICDNADCYEEIKLFIKYKIAKGNGWDESLNQTMTFGQAVLNDMERINKDTIEDKNIENKDDEVIKRIALYFGYLYWTKASEEKGRLGGR